MIRLIVVALWASTLVQCTLDPNTIPKFKTNLPLSFPVYKPKVTFPQGTFADNPHSINELLAANPSFLSKYTVTTKEVSQQILPEGFPKTKIYAYGGDCYDSLSGSSLGTVHSWPGPAFLLQRYGRVQTTWRNGLTGKHMFKIERNLDFMHKGINFDRFIPNVAHVHGMSNPSKFDGVPEAWFTNDGQQGDDYYTNGNPKIRNESVYPMANQQEEAFLFYHDHSMAMTRLNIYAGLAGVTLIQDPQSHLSRTFDRKHDIVLAIADRTFNQDGSLYYPSTGPAPEFPNWVPEFFGDVMVVNGKAYPNMNVEQNLYRVRLLNSCNSRGLTISFVEEQTQQLLSFTLYKSDSCYHFQSIKLTALDLPVAGRAEIVIDFSKVTGRVIMRNVPMPKTNESKDPAVPNLVSLNDGSTGQGTVSIVAATSTDHIMTFSANIKVKDPIKVPSAPAVLNSNLLIFPFNVFNLVVRFYTLYEVTNAAGNSIGVFINGAHMGAENEIFHMSKEYDLQFINLTPDIHPIHMHLVNFQFYKRATLGSAKYTSDWLALNKKQPPYNGPVKVMDPKPYLTGAWEELGGVHRVWRDMVNAEPNVVTVVRLRFKYNTGNSFPADVKGSRYVMHCHIVEHEDNAMMRYFTVQ